MNYDSGSWFQRVQQVVVVWPLELGAYGRDVSSPVEDRKLTVKQDGPRGKRSPQIHFLQLGPTFFSSHNLPKIEPVARGQMFNT